MKAYYEIPDDVVKIVMELTQKCKEIDLGNVGFTIYSVPEVNYYISQYRTYWELIVKHEKRNPTGSGRESYYGVTDIYKIEGNLIYQSSESDLD